MKQNEKPSARKNFMKDDECAHMYAKVPGSRHFLCCDLARDRDLSCLAQQGFSVEFSLNRVGTSCSLKIATFLSFAFYKNIIVA